MQRWILLALLGLPLAVPAAAVAQQFDPGYELTVLGGYGSGTGIDLADGSLDLGSGWAYGAVFGVRPYADEGRMIVLSYHRQRSSFDLNILGRPPASIEVDIGHIQIGGEIDGYVKPYLKPFFGMTLGTAHFTPLTKKATTEWFFSGGFYGGVKFPIGKHFGFRLQGRFQGTLISSSSSLTCVSGQGGACLISVDEISGPIQGDGMGGFYVAF